MFRKSTIPLTFGLTLLTCITGWAQDDAAKIEALEKRIEALESESRDGNEMKVYWKDGLRFDSENGDFKLKFGGRIQNDWAFISEGDEIKSALDAAGTGEASDGAEFRRARLFIGGTIYEHYEFKAQYDFAGSKIGFKDVWIAAKNLPAIGMLKIGQFKEPFGLEELTSSNNISFMERGLGGAFAPSRNTGIGFANSLENNRVTWAGGVFRDADGSGNAFSDNSDGVGITGRITGLAFVNEEVDHYLHFGLATSYRDVDSFDMTGVRPEAHLASKLSSLTVPAARSVNLFGSEIAYTRKSLHLSGEYVIASVDTDSNASDPDFSGYYVQAGYFLTGEHRRYKLGTGVFDRVRPNKNFAYGKSEGFGAIELLARYSHLDLEDTGFAGGELSDITLGLNWYLNPNMRVTLNYVHGELEDGMLGAGNDSDSDTIQTRFQVTW